MFDLLLESFRKASESSMQVPMDILKNLTQQLPSASGAAMEWSKTFQKRWAEFAIESLNKHRESLDSTYRSGSSSSSRRSGSPRSSRPTTTSGSSRSSGGSCSTCSSNSPSPRFATCNLGGEVVRDARASA